MFNWRWFATLSLVWLVSACAAVNPTLTGPVQEIALSAIDIDYAPKTIEVVANQPVRLTLTNEGKLEHDFNIRTIPVMDVHQPENSHTHGGHTESGDLHLSAPAGGSAVLEFTPTIPGEYEFYCTVAGHKDAGAFGTLIVKTP